MSDDRPIPTIRDVARASGVSAPTVSRALRGDAVIREETRARILEAVRVLGYRLPSAAPTAPAERRLTLGVYNVGGFTGPGYQLAVLAGMLGRSHAAHHSLLIVEMEFDPRQSHRNIRLHLDGRCDGLVYLYEGSDEAYKAALRERGTPLVVIGDPTVQDPTVDLDHDDAIRQGVRYLRDLGHRRIVFLSGNEAFAHATVVRRESFHRQCVGEDVIAEVAEQPIWVNGEDFTTAWIADWTARPPKERPTAAFCWNDGMATAILHTAEQWGVAIPQELSVVGIDDDPYLIKSDPEAMGRLTTVAQPYDEIGSRAVDLLLDLIAGKTDTERQIFLPGQLIVRGTTAPPQDFSPAP